MATLTGPYDEAQLRAGLEALSPDRRVAFACSVAESSFPLYFAYATASGGGDAPALRAALDLAWSLAAGACVSAGDVAAARDTSEGLVPDDEDEDWMLLSPLGQNAAAAVAYAMRTWLTGDAQEAVWAARQLHEAADYLVQLQAPEHEYSESSSEPPMTIAVQAIESALAGAGTAPIADLREQAEQAGTSLSRMLESDREQA